MSELMLLKLGGSAITDKTKPFTARTDESGDIARGEQVKIVKIVGGTAVVRLLQER